MSAARPGRAEQLACLRPGSGRGFQPSLPHQVSVTLQQPQSPRAAPGRAHVLRQPSVPSPSTLLGQGATGGTDRQTDVPRHPQAGPASGCCRWHLADPGPSLPDAATVATPLHLRTQQGCAGAGSPPAAAGRAYDTHTLPRSPAPSTGPQHPPHAGLGQEQGGRSHGSLAGCRRAAK